MSVLAIPRPQTPISRQNDPTGALIDQDWYRFFNSLRLVFGANGTILPSSGGTGIPNADSSTITLAGPFAVTTNGGSVSFPSAGTTMTFPASSKTLMATDFSNAPGAGGNLSGTYPNPTVAKVNGVSYPAAPATGTVPVVTSANTITYQSIGTFAGTLGGDLSGTLPNPTVAKINGNPLGSTTPTAGNALIADGLTWKSTAIAHGSHAEVTGSGGTSTSATGTMLGAAGSITPATTGVVYFIITGTLHHSNAGGSFNYQIRYGTGAAPANGAALIGTAIGILLGGQSSTAGNKVPFSSVAIVSGLTLATAYWYDISLDNGGAGTATVDSAVMDAIEL